jgi:glycosyltransferase involved in cell wall biosynthesis
MKNPLVSVITVVYNGEKYLEQTVQSVIDQTYKNIEYLIIDGGSTDGTLNIIKKYEKQIAYWVSEPDKGLYDAMNKGIELAKGELIGMINSDDWYELHTVQLMAEAYLNNPSKNIFHADRFDILEGGERKIRKFNPSNFKFKYYGMTYNHPSMFITRAEYQKHLYNTNLRALSDYQFVLEAFLRNRNGLFYLAKPIVNYRLDGISAKMSLVERLREGFIARREAGFGIMKNALSLFIRLVVFSFYKKRLLVFAFKLWIVSLDFKVLFEI